MRAVTRGFTLLEILVALVVFAILATITSSTMYYAFNTRTRVTDQAERLVMLELAITLLQRDIEQTVPRSVLGNEMRLFPIFVGQPTYVEFTRGGLINPGNKEQRSTLKRVAWLCKNNNLIRRTFNSLDSVSRDHYSDTVVLDSLLLCKFAYLDTSSQVLDEWRGGETGTASSPDTLPKAIRISLTLNHWGDSSFLFLLPRALYTNETT